MLRGNNSYLAEHSRRQVFDRNSLVSLGRLDPDKLLTDRTAYISYLETQLDQVTSALLASRASEGSDAATDSALRSFREKMHSMEHKVSKLLDLIKATQGYAEEQEELSKQGITKLASRMKRTEQRLADITNTVDRTVHSAQQLPEDVLARHDANMQELIRREVSDAMELWRAEHESRVTELQEAQNQLQSQVKGLQGDLHRGLCESKANNEDMRTSQEIVSADAQRALRALGLEPRQQAAAAVAAAAADSMSTHTHERQRSTTGASQDTAGGLNDSGAGLLTKVVKMEAAYELMQRQLETMRTQNDHSYSAEEPSSNHEASRWTDVTTSSVPSSLRSTQERSTTPSTSFSFQSAPVSARRPVMSARHQTTTVRPTPTSVGSEHPLLASSQASCPAPKSSVLQRLTGVLRAAQAIQESSISLAEKGDDRFGPASEPVRHGSPRSPRLDLRTTSMRDSLVTRTEPSSPAKQQPALGARGPTSPEVLSSRSAGPLHEAQRSTRLGHRNTGTRDSLVKRTEPSSPAKQQPAWEVRGPASPEAPPSRSTRALQEARRSLRASAEALEVAKQSLTPQPSPPGSSSPRLSPGWGSPYRSSAANDSWMSIPATEVLDGASVQNSLQRTHQSMPRFSSELSVQATERLSPSSSCGVVSASMHNSPQQREQSLSRFSSAPSLQPTEELSLGTEHMRGSRGTARSPDNAIGPQHAQAPQDTLPSDASSLGAAAQTRTPADSDRLERLENMMEQMLTQVRTSKKAKPRRSSKSTGARTRAPLAVPRLPAPTERSKSAPRSLSRGKARSKSTGRARERSHRQIAKEAQAAEATTQLQIDAVASPLHPMQPLQHSADSQLDSDAERETSDRVEPPLPRHSPGSSLPTASWARESVFQQTSQRRERLESLYSRLQTM